MGERMISFCGLDCMECPAYIGTKKGNRALLKKTAEGWSTPEEKIAPDDIICDGCVLLGKRLARFSTECPVRICGIEKGVENCGFCKDYPCEKLKKRWELVKTPEARDRLDEINQRDQIGFKQE